MRTFFILKGLKFAFFAIVFVLLLGWATMTAWNYVIPGIFHLTAIDYWQALALVILSRILFWTGGGSWGRRHGYNKEHYRKMIENRMENLSPEQKEKVKMYWASKCGMGSRYYENNNPESTENS